LSFSNSVIVKAAGNDGDNLMNYALNYTLLKDSVLKKRTLIVGALKGNTIAYYSNVPGNNRTAQKRFIMENGDTNFVYGYHDYDGADLSDKNVQQGTSFAAPRISGYVALLRHKFSGLSANHSANILLDTAGYDDLQCNPNCDKSVYGQGKANLGKAMSPIGNLR
jgi:subtilisin family serine protease